MYVQQAKQAGAAVVPSDILVRTSAHQRASAPKAKAPSPVGLLAALSSREGSAVRTVQHAAARYAPPLTQDTAREIFETREKARQLLSCLGSLDSVDLSFESGP